MRKPKKVKVKREKKDKVKEIDEKAQWKEEFLNIEEDDNESVKILCSNCGKDAMKSTGLCIDCYRDISSDMAKTVNAKDSEPWKLNGTYKKLQDLIDGVE